MPSGGGILKIGAYDEVVIKSNLAFWECSVATLGFSHHKPKAKVIMNLNICCS